MSKQMKILVEITIDDPKVKLDAASANAIKAGIEENLVGPGNTLAKYCWSLGIYHDAEVVQVSKKKVYDVRQ